MAYFLQYCFYFYTPNNAFIGGTTLVRKKYKIIWLNNERHLLVEF